MIYLLTIIFFASAWANGFHSEPEIDMSDISGIKGYEMKNGKPAIYTDCTRECKAGALKRVCYYRFVLELYQAMGAACGNCSAGVESDCLKPQCVTADGIARVFLSINRMFESPTINVCRGDRIVVDMIVMIAGFQECIHWHGLLQEGSQYYDGVPMLTQCAIQYPDTFRYQFSINKQCGTFFYHSHVGFNKPDGIHGSLVVRCPKYEEVNSDLYDYDLPDHTISVTGWTHRPATMDQHPGVVDRISGIPDTLLINGKGQYTSPDGNTTRTPLAEFKVKHGKKYRFRLINSSSFICQIQIFIEDHNMTIIATDGEPCEPRTVDSLITSPAQRFDFILYAFGKRDSYWIQAKALGPCNEFSQKIGQVGVLIYNKSDKKTIPETPRPTPSNTLAEGVVLAPINNNCTSSSGCVYLMDLPYCGPINKHLQKEKPDIVRYYEVSFGSIPSEDFFSSGTYFPFRTIGDGSPQIGMINNISYLDPVSPPLSQDIDENMFCNKTHLAPTCRKSEKCICTHIESLPLNKVVEFVLYSIDDCSSTINHPMHLHGYSYEMRGMGVFDCDFEVNEHNVRKLHKSGKMYDKRDKYPFMDTVPLFAHGYMVYRIYTSNPGYWLIHCHFDMHMIAGMKFVIKVGTKEDLPPVPKGFPKCGKYMPPIELCSD